MAHRVKVAVRIRPPVEPVLPSQEVVRPTAAHSQEVECVLADVGARAEKKRFTYDYVFPADSTQEQVFDAVGGPVVQHVMEGFNGTVLAYGQTGSGKTHTMVGPKGGAPELLRCEERGLIPRVVATLFDTLAKLPPVEVSWYVSCSILELYNEELFDLCTSPSPSSTAREAVVAAPSAPSSIATDHPSSERVEMRIREDRTSGRGVFVEGLTRIAVTTAEQTLQLIQGAAVQKHIAATAMNETSSRSHTLVMLYVDMVLHVQNDTKVHSQLHLVDLAGSERVGRTGATGARLKEAQNINLSLTTLGIVINKLTDGKSLHVPYRDAKLTRLLQDSLGGNALTSMICTCSSQPINAHETLSTLLFASRAKCIQNVAHENKELSPSELRRVFQQAQEEIRVLKERLQLLELGGVIPPQPPSDKPSASTPTSGGEDDILEELRSTVRSLTIELAQEREARLLVEKDAALLQQRVAFYETQNSDLQTQIADWKSKWKRENLACEAWVRKYQESMNLASRPEGHAVPQPPKPKEAKSVLVDPKKKTGVKPAGSATKPPGTGKDSPSDASTPTTTATATSMEEGDASTPEAREMRALVRERMLLSEVEQLRERLEKEARSGVIVDRLTRELAQAKEDALVQTEKLTQQYESTLKRHDQEIAELQLKLDLRVAERDAALASPPTRSAQQDEELARLREENDALHQENRANATRLLDFVKRIDLYVKEINTLKDDQARLKREVESANLSAELKARILGTRLVSERSVFRQKLLNCFARDDDDDTR